MPMTVVSLLEIFTLVISYKVKNNQDCSQPSAIELINGPIHWAVIEFVDQISGHFNITAFQIKFARWINEECGAVIDCQLSRPLTSNNIVVNFRQNATNANTVVLLVFKDHCLPIDSKNMMPIDIIIAVIRSREHLLSSLAHSDLKSVYSNCTENAWPAQDNSIEMQTSRPESVNVSRTIGISRSKLAIMSKIRLAAEDPLVTLSSSDSMVKGSDTFDTASAVSSAISRSSVSMLQLCRQMIEIKISSMRNFNCIKSLPKPDMIIIVGHWNARVGRVRCRCDDLNNWQIWHRRPMCQWGMSSLCRKA
ncbi:unnamed protein product [Dracunculus medinensis]|uniref:Endo/exonuclease/phosphatase domain-containing protein n=1 Tax=Dracunculus medinensis TaxID=318479 RepID=A0A0N4UI03_DRAME|nr:unnamed protein product [Dracunculus medinensis]